MRSPLLVLLPQIMIACAPQEPAIDVVHGALQTTANHQIRLRAVVTSNSDGTLASPVTVADMVDAVPVLNDIYAGTGVQFVFDPASDFETRSSNLLNQDFGVIGSLANYTDPNVEPPTSAVVYDIHKRAVADEQRGKLTIFFRWPSGLAFDDVTDQWQWVPWGGGAKGSSSDNARYVNYRGPMDAVLLGHELGHYFHLPHVFAEFPKGQEVKTVADAAAKIEAYVAAGNSVLDGLDVFDGDKRWVNDTPPDARGAIYEDVFGVDRDGDGDYDNNPKCFPGTIYIPVNIPDGPAAYILDPDRGLVMSYFGCADPMYLSDDQATRVLDSVHHLNRAELSSITPLSAMFLSQKSTASAGSVVQVAAARIGHRRLVTATLDGQLALKLIVWDVGATGGITRRGDVVVGGSLGDFAVTSAGLDQVVIAHRDLGGALSLKTYKVSSAGALTLQDARTETEIATDIAITQVAAITFATSIRTGGMLRVIVHRINADGSIERIAHGDGAAIAAIEATQYNPAADPGEAIEGAITTFARTTTGSVLVQSWELDASGGSWEVRVVDDETAGATNQVAAAQVDFDLAASIVRTQTNEQKIILWHTNYFGDVTRRGDKLAGSCTHVAGARIGVQLLSTACRDAASDALVMRLFQVSPGGQTVTQKASLTLGGVTEVALVTVGDNMVVSVARTTGGTLSLRSFAAGGFQL